MARNYVLRKPNGLEAKIESLWAKGNYSTERIAGELNIDRAHAARVVSLIRAHSRIEPDALGDDDKHLAKIRKHHGAGFPYYATAKIEAAGL